MNWNWLISSSALLCVAPVALAQPSAPLSDADVLRAIRTYHPKLAAMRIAVDAAIAKAREKRGAFDPILSVGADSMRYNSSSTPGKALTTLFTETSVEVLSRSGAKFYLGQRFNDGSVKSPNTAAGGLGEWFFGVKIPLSRDRNVNEKTIAEKQAILGEPLAEFEFSLTQLSVMRDGLLSYWDWRGSEDKLRVQKNLVDLAATRRVQIDDFVRAGSRRKLDIIEADSQVSQRRANVLVAERDRLGKSLKLQTYLWMSEAGPQSAPTTDQASRLVLPEAPIPLEAEAAIKTALDNRPELGAIVVSRRILQLDLDLAKNLRRPQWNLVLQPGVDPGTNGIGGTYKAGIFFSVPLRWNTADGAADNARLKLAKLGAEEIGLRQQITNEVLDALGAVKLAHARAIEAQKAVEQLRQVENGERIMFELGGSSLFLLNQREQATADAESRAIDAIVAYFQSVTLLEASLTELQRKPL